MQLLEHEAKQKARTAGLSIPNGYVAYTPDEAAAAAQRLGDRIVVKAQVRSGGRGKAGGVIVTERSHAGEAARRLLGSRIAGHQVELVLVEEYITAEQQLYLAVTVDAQAASPVLLVGSHGGIDVNDYSLQTGRVPVAYFTGVQPWHLWQAERTAGLDPAILPSLLQAARVLFKVFTECRAELVEVNPLMVTRDSQLIAADVRLVVDASAEPRPGAMSREQQGFDFVELDANGTVGLITTGAGASMMLVDLLREAGVAPINFCDIRSGSFKGSAERLVSVLRALNRYPRLTCIAVNIFAGITDLKEFADLLVVAISREAVAVPLVLRLEGPGAELARKSLAAAGLPCEASLEQLVVEVAATINTPRTARPGIG